MKRFIIVRVGKHEQRVDITHCFWCSGVDKAICSACGEKAEAVRRKLKQQDVAQAAATT